MKKYFHLIALGILAITCGAFLYMQTSLPGYDENLGVTSLVNTMTGSTSMALINSNFSELNTDITNLEASTTKNLITSIPNLSTIGTITTGVWNGTAIGDAYIANDITASNYLALTAWYATTTDALTEGSTNLYWTQTRFDEALLGTTTIDSITSLPNLTTTMTALPEGQIYVGNASNEATATSSLFINSDGTIDIANINGLDINPGSDVNTDLITVGVTGAPKIYWNETNDKFYMTKGLNASSLYTAGTLTVESSLNILSTQSINVGVYDWNTASDKLNGEYIADDTIDDDSLDFTDITLADFTDDVGYLTLTAWYGTTTDGLDEGVSNLYYTDQRVADYLNGSSTIPTTSYIWDISNNTNLTASGGLQLNGDNIEPASGYSIPLTASTTAFNAYHDWRAPALTASSTDLQATGTTTIPVGGTICPPPFPDCNERFYKALCFTTAGTADIRCGDGTTYSDLFSVTTATSSPSLNYSFQDGDKRFCEIGNQTVTTNSGWVTCTFGIIYD